MEENKKKIMVKGEGRFSGEKIEINKDIDETITISHVRNYIKKLCKKFIGNEDFFLYVAMPDSSCGFIPTPEHTIYDLIDLFGTNNILSLKLSNKIYFG